jgi:hypothetical protein
VLYWYKSTNTDAEEAGGRHACFTGTKVQILTQKKLVGGMRAVLRPASSASVFVLLYQ